MAEDLDEFREFYREVYCQDNPASVPYAWIQWKGTDVCMDVHCECGYDGHVDGEFVYYWRCPSCKSLFALGANVRLIRLNNAQESYVLSSRGGTVRG